MKANGGIMYRIMVLDPRQVLLPSPAPWGQSRHRQLSTVFWAQMSAGCRDSEEEGAEENTPQDGEEVAKVHGHDGQHAAGKGEASVLISFSSFAIHCRELTPSIRGLQSACQRRP